MYALMLYDVHGSVGYRTDFAFIRHLRSTQQKIYVLVEDLLDY